MAQETKLKPTAGNTAKTLEEGDIIRVPQYKNALKVTYTGDLNGEENAYIGVQFSDESKRTSANKSMIVNQHSSRVYLTAGSTDKGEVTEIEIVAKVKMDGDDDNTNEDETDEENEVGTVETDNTQEAPADGGSVDEQTEDTPEIGQNLDERTHYAHVRYASRDHPGVIWYDPRDGRENFQFDVTPMEELDVGESTVAHVNIRPYRPKEYGIPADRYVVNITRTEKELFNHDTDPFETTKQYVRSEQMGSIEEAREYLREKFEEYEKAPRKDAVRTRS